MVEYRFPLEMIETGFHLPMNPSDVYDQSSVYIYRVLHTLPVTINITFISPGLSYVEVYDADNSRFLLSEKTEINETTTFNIVWDGYGVFEPRVWKDSNVTGMYIEFELPDNETAHKVFPSLDISNAVGLIGFGIFCLGMVKKW